MRGARVYIRVYARARKRETETNIFSRALARPAYRRERMRYMIDASQSELGTNAQLFTFFRSRRAVAPASHPKDIDAK